MNNESVYILLPWCDVFTRETTLIVKNIGTRLDYILLKKDWIWPLGAIWGESIVVENGMNYLSFRKWLFFELQKYIFLEG